KPTRGRRTYQWRVVGIPGAASVARGEYPSHRRTAGRDPGVLQSLGGDASPAGGKGRLTGERRRHIVGDGMPTPSVPRTQLRKHATYRIAVSEAAAGGPERKAIVERSGKLVGELDRPVRATVVGFVDPKVCRVVANGEQVGNFVTHALHVAELQ